MRLPILHTRLFALAAAISWGCAGSPDSIDKANEDNTMSLHITSSAFVAGGIIPKKCTADGADVSPPLEWNDPPAGTKSFALICDDPDAPVGTWVHWVL